MWVNIFCARERPEYIPAIAPLFKNNLKECEISVNWVLGFVLQIILNLSNCLKQWMGEQPAWT
jgi:hypothetical protein